MSLADGGRRRFLTVRFMTFDRLDRDLERHADLERRLTLPEVQADPAEYARLAREYGQLTPAVQRYRELLDARRALAEARELSADPELREMADEERARLEPEVARLEEELTDLLLEEPDDLGRKSLIVEIRAGTGGEEASLFARDLFEMYRRFAEDQGWKFETVEASVSDTRGFKEVVFSITGVDAWRMLRFESGGHRVQRVPETEAQGRIHTSAATVAVLPEPEEVELEIRPEDIEMEATRSSGPGGQHVNKTSSAVRLTHLPTGLVVFCQDERSQLRNRQKALRLLRSRLFERMQRDAHAKRASARRTLIGSGDRSDRIRTYNFPQNRCTDHRLGENFPLEEVIAGRLRRLIGTLLAFDRKERLAAMTTS
jgi:peptide chain release factor 1